MEAKIKECHEYMIKNHFYDCPECGGTGYMLECDPLDERELDQATVPCPYCGSSGIDPNKNIGEMIMGAVSELAMAVEARKIGKLSFIYMDTGMSTDNDWKELKRIGPSHYDFFIKNSFEDRMAMALIRVFDLCIIMDVDKKELGIENKKRIVESITNNIEESILHICGGICGLLNHRVPIKNTLAVGFAIARIMVFCEKYNIPIERHISARLEYCK